VEAARGATADDIDAVVELARALRAELRELRGGALWEIREARPEPLEVAFRAWIDDPDAYVVVGTLDEHAVVGYAVVQIETLRDATLLGVITELFVDGDARGVGVGEAIANLLIEFCENARCVGIDATALPGHRAAKNFFERSGFTARAITMHRRL